MAWQVLTLYWLANHNQIPWCSTPRIKTEYPCSHLRKSGKVHFTSFTHQPRTVLAYNLTRRMASNFISVTTVSEACTLYIYNICIYVHFMYKSSHKNIIIRVYIYIHIQYKFCKKVYIHAMDPRVPWNLEPHVMAHQRKKHYSQKCT